MRTGGCSGLAPHPQRLEPRSSKHRALTELSYVLASQGIPAWSEFDGFASRDVSAGCHGRAAALVLACLVVPPVLIVLFRGQGGDEVVVLAIDRARQLEIAAPQRA